MNTTHLKPRQRLHPILWIAALCLILFCVVGVGAITGVIPTSHSQAPEPLAATDRLPDAKNAPSTRIPVIEEYEDDLKPAPRAAAPAAPASSSGPKPAPMRMARAPGEAAPASRQAPPRSPAYAYDAPPAAGNAPNNAPRAVCRDCGTVTAVRTIEQKGEGSGAGAVAGGVAGGVLGHQMGNGRGQDVMTVVGAVGGAFAGHETEKHLRKTVKHVVTVRFEDGSTRNYTFDKAPGLQNGQPVRAAGGSIRAI